MSLNWQLFFIFFLLNKYKTHTRDLFKEFSLKTYKKQKKKGETRKRETKITFRAVVSQQSSRVCGS